MCNGVLLKNEKAVPIETKLPFIAQIVTGIIGYFLTVFFLDKSIGLLFLAIVLATVVLYFLKFGLWAFYASITYSFLTDSLGNNDLHSAKIIGIIYLGATLINLLVYIWQSLHFKKIGISLEGHGNTVRNTFFCILGTSVSLAAYLFIFDKFFTIFNSGATIDTPEELVPFLWMICGIFGFFPIFWGPLFAAVSQVNFNFSKPGRILFLAILGFLIGGFISGLAAFVLQFVLAIVKAVIQNDTLDFLVFSVFFIFFISVGWGVGILDKGKSAQQPAN